MSPIDPHSCSNALVSRFLGCSANTLSVLAGKGIVPREKRGRYDLFKAVPAFIAHRKGENEATRDEVIGKHRVVQERIRKLRIENNQKAATLIDAKKAWTLSHEIASILGGMIRTRIATDSDLITTLSKEQSPLKILGMMQDVVNGALGDIHRALSSGGPID